MTSRERVLTALEHREPDRVPVDFWASSETTTSLLRHLGLASKQELLREFGADLRVVEGPSFVGQEMAHEDGAVLDLWGVPRRPVTVGGEEFEATYLEVTAPPLAHAASAAEVLAYPHWPSPDWWDYSQVAAQCDACAGYAVVNAGDRKDRTAQLKPAMYLRGVEQIMLDMAQRPEIVDAIVGRIVDYFLEYDRRVFEAASHGHARTSLPDPSPGREFPPPRWGRSEVGANAGRGAARTPHPASPAKGGGAEAPARQPAEGNKIDIFMMGDDFGMQRGLLCSVAMWRRHFREGFRQYIELAHQYGIKVMHHTCGSVRELIPDFIACGLDILQSLQPRASGMDLGELKREFGRDLCFHGSVDIQETLPRGTPAMVRDEVRRRMEAGKPGGGFIICTAHNLQADTPLDNIIALIEAYREFGAC
jgi:hypothetical protein